MKKGFWLGVSLISLAVFFAGSAFAAKKEGVKKESFYFVQLSDTHWGFNDAKINPDYAGTLKKAIATINSMRPQPDFVVFSGDDTHTTDDPGERRKRLAEFLAITKTLKVKDIKYLPGEHDAGLDQGAAYKELIGASEYSFAVKGVHFAAIDNVSQPQSTIGEKGLQWLAADLKGLKPDSKIIILAHRPLLTSTRTGTGTPKTGARPWTFWRRSGTSRFFTGTSIRSTCARRAISSTMPPTA